jgi:hypothetical protein
LTAKLQDLFTALPVGVLKRIQRLSKETGESIETVVDRAIALYEKRVKSRLITGDDELAQLMSNPKNRVLFEQISAAMSRRGNASLTPEQRSNRSAKAGTARAKALTKKERSDIAKAGAAARWGRQKKKTE